MDGLSEHRDARLQQRHDASSAFQLLRGTLQRGGQMNVYTTLAWMSRITLLLLLPYGGNLTRQG